MTFVLTFEVRYDRIERSKKYADVSELADEPVLETGAYACRFKSCHPHQKNHFIRSGFSVIFAVFHGELYAPSVRDICFASDMPAGVRGEYNITETVGFNITFCVAKYITPSKTEYH